MLQNGGYELGMWRMLKVEMVARPGAKGGFKGAAYMSQRFNPVENQESGDGPGPAVISNITGLYRWQSYTGWSGGCHRSMRRTAQHTPWTCATLKHDHDHDRQQANGIGLIRVNATVEVTVIYRCTACIGC